MYMYEWVYACMLVCLYWWMYTYKSTQLYTYMHTYKDTNCRIMQRVAACCSVLPRVAACLVILFARDHAERLWKTICGEESACACACQQVWLANEEATHKENEEATVSIQRERESKTGEEVVRSEQRNVTSNAVDQSFGEWGRGSLENFRSLWW